MSIHLFKSMNGQKAAPPPTQEDLARELAMEMIDGIKARRAEAQAAELACEPTVETTPEDQERYDTLEALLKGRHRKVVLQCLLEHFPELVAQMKVN